MLLKGNLLELYFNFSNYSYNYRSKPEIKLLILNISSCNVVRVLIVGVFST